MLPLSALTVALTLQVAASLPSPALPYRPGPVVVAWDHGPDAFAAAAAALGCHHPKPLTGLRALYRASCPATSAAAQAALHAAWHRAGARWAEPAYTETPHDAQDADTYDADTHDPAPVVTPSPARWHLLAVGAPAAWQARRGCQNILVAVIDTGIWADHPALRGARWQNPGEVCGNGLDDDGNGLPDDCHGWDFGADDPDPSPLTLPALKPDGSPCRARHATFIAGLIAATPPDLTTPDTPDDPNAPWGVCGGAASLLNIKKHPDDTCLSTTADSAEAIGYALAMGARVLLLPFLSDAPSAALDEALQAASAQGAVTVIPAGNYADDADALPRYPIHSPHALSLVVAATTEAGARWSGSSWGATKVHAAAPGAALTSITLPTDPAGHPTSPTSPIAAPTATASGTSYAAALAAGLLALTWAASPDISAEAALDTLRANAAPLPDLTCDPTTAPARPCVRWGALLQAPPAPPTPPTPDPDPTHHPEADTASDLSARDAPPQAAADCACDTPHRLPAQASPRWLLLAVAAVALTLLCRRRTARSPKTCQEPR